MPSLTTARGLLGNFPWGADLPANDPCATIPPIRFLTSSSLQAISAAGARGWSAGGGASGGRGPREVGRGGEVGEAKSEGWSGGSDVTSDAEREEDGLGHALLTELPWGMQESGSRRLRVDARAGGSDGRKVPPRQPTRK